jgi:hypothetical protein
MDPLWVNRATSECYRRRCLSNRLDGRDLGKSLGLLTSSQLHDALHSDEDSEPEDEDVDD